MSNLKGIEKLKDLEIENLEGLQIEKKTELVREIAIEYLEKLERPELITQQNLKNLFLMLLQLSLIEKNIKMEPIYSTLKNNY